MSNTVVTSKELASAVLSNVKLLESKYGCFVKELYKAKNNIYTCLSDMVLEFMINDSIPESVVEEVLEETLKYMEFIQRRLDEISVDKPEQSL